MKKLAFQVLTSLLMVMMLLSLIQMPVEASTNDKKFIIQKEEKEFIIYYKDLCNNQFNFAFSTNKNESKDDLVFITSVEDKLQDEKLNVAYTNENLYDTYFKDNENKAYIWIKDSEGKYKVEAELIDLTQDVMTDEQIEYVKNTTKRINGDEQNSSITNMWTDKKNVKHTVVLSQYVISMEKDTVYYYQIVKIPEGAKSEEAKLYDLADKLQKGIDSKYEQFSAQKEFYELYNKLYPELNDTKWEKTDDGCIVEPKDTITGDRYIIWLKAEKDGETTKDAKFLLCYQEDEEKKEKYTPVELVRTPKTYDSKALIIGFAVIAVLIIIVLILRKKSSDK